MPNVIEALRAAFGPRADQQIDLDGLPQTYLDEPVYPLELCTARADGDIRGRVFVKCGGEAFATLRPVSTSTRLRFYLTYDDNLGSRWDAVRARHDWSEPPEGDDRDAPGRGPRPCARLRLVASI